MCVTLTWRRELNKKYKYIGEGKLWQISPDLTFKKEWGRRIRSSLTVLRFWLYHSVSISHFPPVSLIRIGYFHQKGSKKKEKGQSLEVWILPLSHSTHDFFSTLLLGHPNKETFSNIPTTWNRTGKFLRFFTNTTLTRGGKNPCSWGPRATFFASASSLKNGSTLLFQLEAAKTNFRCNTSGFIERYILVIYFVFPFGLEKQPNTAYL